MQHGEREKIMEVLGLTLPITRNKGSALTHYSIWCFQNNAKCAKPPSEHTFAQLTDKHQQWNKFSV